MHSINSCAIYFIFGSCYLKKLLEKRDVEFGDEIRDDIENLIDMTAIHHQSPFIVKPGAYLSNLLCLLTSINKFLEPLQPCLQKLVFFELQQSELFESYLKNNLMYESQGLSSALPAVTKEHLNGAVMSTIELIWKLCDGSATVQQVL